MGEGSHCPHAGIDRRRRAQGQPLLRNFAALAAAGLVCLASAQPKVTFDKANAWSHLVKQCEFGPRPPGSEAHVKCRDYIVEEAKKHGQNVRLQPFEHTWSKTRQPVKMWNVLAEQNWENAKVRVALFAHWDTRPTADMELDPVKAAKPIVGANDGASGVAVLLELMRAMKDVKSDVGILYVFLDGEDLGPDLDEMFLGAKAFAKSMPTPKPQYGILLDMIGDKNLTVPMEQNSYSFAPELTRALYAHAKEVGLGNTFPSRYGDLIEDDHIPLNQAGLPTVDLIDFTYPAWHTMNDTPDKCSPESLLKVGTLLETWLKKPVPYKPKEK